MAQQKLVRLVFDSNALGERHEAVLGECDRPPPL